ncbi:MAG: RluA family pseudouridine synthase [Planctomycetota bacterium]|jgi:23S rRNA pseudouridine1911/1915/1917 synthase
MRAEFAVEEHGTLEEAAATLFVHLSLGGIRRAIAAGEILLNGRRASREKAVKPGDALSIEAEISEARSVKADVGDLAILFEDADLIAVDKPAGLPVIPTRESNWWLLMAMLLGHSEDCPSCRGKNVRFRIVHRLDRDTSGVLLVAKTLESARGLSAAFAEGSVAKRYLALVRGEAAAEEGTIDVPLAPAAGRKAMKVSPDGKASRTDWRIAERFRGFTLVEAGPRTGRTHQIRVHLAALGLPLAVDEMYGGASGLCLSEFKRPYRIKGAEKPLISRLTLHCAGVEFAHPRTGTPVKVEAPLPEDFTRALKALKKYARKQGR